MDKAGFMAAADHQCQQQGVKLTALRRQVLELVLAHEGVVKAYQVLADLQRERGIAAPPTVYRALDFLLEQGLIHRINVLNAFIGCPSPTIKHQSHFLICRHCGIAVELDQPALSEQILSVAREAGFTVETQALEVSGLCANCANHTPERALA